TGLASATSSSSSPPASGTAYTQSSLPNTQSSLPNAQSTPAGATQSSFTTTTPSLSPNAAVSSTKLSTDAVIGIAVGGVVLIAIMGIIGCMCFRYGQRRSPKEAEATGIPRTIHRRRLWGEKRVNSDRLYLRRL